jgi:hypothetical protein
MWSGSCNHSTSRADLAQPALHAQRPTAWSRAAQGRSKGRHLPVTVLVIGLPSETAPQLLEKQAEHVLCVGNPSGSRLDLATELALAEETRQPMHDRPVQGRLDSPVSGGLDELDQVLELAIGASAGGFGFWEPWGRNPSLVASRPRDQARSGAGRSPSHRRATRVLGASTNSRPVKRSPSVQPPFRLLGPSKLETDTFAAPRSFSVERVRRVLQKFLAR